MRPAVQSTRRAKAEGITLIVHLMCTSTDLSAFMIRRAAPYSVSSFIFRTPHENRARN